MINFLPGLDTDLDTLLGMEDLNIEFDDLPDLADAEEDSSSSILKRLSGLFSTSHTSRQTPQNKPTTALRKIPSI